MADRRVLLALALAAAFAGPARADCGQDMQKLAQARNAELEKVNTFAKAAHGKPLDPEAFCVKSAGLLKAEVGDHRLHGQEQGLVLLPRRRDQQPQGEPRQERRLQRQGLRGRRQDQEDEGAGGAGRAAAPQAQPLPPARFDSRRERAPFCPTRGRRASSCGSRRISRCPSSSSPGSTGRSAGSFCSRPAGRRRRSRACRSIAGRTSAHLALFLVGAIAMRGAGSTYNDILDRELDAGVERTRGRPLPSGRVGVRAAAAFLVAQALVGLAVLFSFNRFSIGLGIASLAIVAIYPLMKRVTSWPQAVLGLAFSWGALIGWSATFGGLALAPVAALRVGLLLDDRLRHDLRPAGRARRRHRRHPLDGAPVRRERAARRRPVLRGGGGAGAGRDPRRRRRSDRARRLARLRRASRLAGARRSTARIPATALTLFRSNRDAGLILFAGIALQGWIG